MAKRKKVPKEESERVQITFKKINSEDILKPGAKLEVRDMTQFHEEEKNKVEVDKLRYEKEVDVENKRFNNLPCPSCKSKKKIQQKITQRNGPVIYGGINGVNILADYLICQSCGTMYVDLNKKEITPPYKSYNGIYSRTNFY